MLTTDLVVAMGLLALAVIPLSFSFHGEQKLCRIFYYRSVAMEIVDGEMEKLLAGKWHQYHAGSQAYTVTADAAQNLKGEFVLQLNNDTLRLEYKPNSKDQGGHIVRESKIK